MMLIQAAQSFLMAQRVIQMHGASPCNRKDLIDACLHQFPGNVVGYFDLHWESPPVMFCIVLCGAFAALFSIQCY